MKKIVKLTESDLLKIVKNVINEKSINEQFPLNQLRAASKEASMIKSTVSTEKELITALKRSGVFFESARMLEKWILNVIKEPYANFAKSEANLFSQIISFFKNQGQTREVAVKSAENYLNALSKEIKLDEGISYEMTKFDNWDEVRDFIVKRRNATNWEAKGAGLTDSQKILRYDWGESTIPHIFYNKQNILSKVFVKNVLSQKYSSLIKQSADSLRKIKIPIMSSIPKEYNEYITYLADRLVELNYYLKPDGNLYRAIESSYRVNEVSSELFKLLSKHKGGSDFYYKFIDPKLKEYKEFAKALDADAKNVIEQEKKLPGFYQNVKNREE